MSEDEDGLSQSFKDRLNSIGKQEKRKENRVVCNNLKYDSAIASGTYVDAATGEVLQK